VYRRNTHALGRALRREVDPPLRQRRPGDDTRPISGVNATRVSPCPGHGSGTTPRLGCMEWPTTAVPARALDAIGPGAGQGRSGRFRAVARLACRCALGTSSSARSSYRTRHAHARPHDAEPEARTRIMSIAPRTCAESGSPSARTEVHKTL
jgi:hypothetical protein